MYVYDFIIIRVLIRELLKLFIIKNMKLESCNVQKKCLPASMRNIGSGVSVTLCSDVQSCIPKSFTRRRKIFPAKIWSIVLRKIC